MLNLSSTAFLVSKPAIFSSSLILFGIKAGSFAILSSSLTLLFDCKARVSICNLILIDLREQWKTLKWLQMLKDLLTLKQGKNQLCHRSNIQRIEIIEMETEEREF
jgi:hypothetical protein